MTDQQFKTILAHLQVMIAILGVMAGVLLALRVGVFDMRGRPSACALSVQELLEELSMAKPGKTTGNLFASMEDDLKQFWAALSGAVRASAGAIADRVRLAAPPRNDQPADPKRLSGGQE
jgi:hypothetical protein